MLVSNYNTHTHEELTSNITGSKFYEQLVRVHITECFFNSGERAATTMIDKRFKMPLLRTM